MTLKSIQFKNLGVTAARLADDKKASGIVLLDLHGSYSGLSDYLLVMNATSEVHMKALQQYIEDAFDSIGMKPLHKDGTRGGQWLVIDYGGLLVHIFTEESRRVFSLERLWENAKEVAWSASAPKKSKSKKAKPSKRKRS